VRLVRRSLFVVAVLGAALVLGSLSWRDLMVASTPVDALLPPPALEPSGQALPAAVRRPARDDPPSPSTPAMRASFEELASRLVDLAVRGVDEVGRGDLRAAQATDVAATAVVSTIVTTITDYEQRALFALTGLVGEDSRSATARGAFGRLLHLGLQKLAARASAGDPRPLAAFLDALLEEMVPHEPIAAVIAWLLIDQPYLGPEQERAVLRLAELAAAYPWLADPVRRLLLTLWRNLEAGGVRPREQTELLALTFKDDPNPARRAAALERLVTSSDEDLVRFVVQDIELRGDADRARDLAMAAANALPVGLALEVVRRLRPVGSQALLAPALELARRAEAEVRTSYEELLAADADRDFRADLVSGLGFNPSRANLALVEHAFRTDPAVSVRERALLALTANAAAALGERSVAAALEDVELCGARGERAGVLLGALENLARAGELDAMQRLGRRLAARRDLSPAVRSELERLLTEGPPPRPF